MSTHKIELCSGFGQYHSETHKTNPKPYKSITLFDIAGRLSSPDNIDKEAAQWFIPSSLKSRDHKFQRENGQFYALWADIDEPDSQTFIDMYLKAQEIIQTGLMGYTSKSATEENQKARLIVPLAKPVNGNDFVLLQEILNNKLQAAGIAPDRATQRAGQLCYLPNEGAFYSFEYNEEPDFVPSLWKDEVRGLRERKQQEAEALKVSREQSRMKAAERVASGKSSPIDAFNEAYDLETMFSTFGYLRKGNRWLSPNSDSNQPGVIISDDGRKWISSHGSDSHMGQPINGGTLGDPFDLLTWFEHGGDRNKAIKAAADMFNLNQQKQNQQAGEKAASQLLSEEGAKKPFSLKQFALNGQSKKMRSQMLADKFVLGKLAILGQWTVFYAPPNAGKTLITMCLLIDAIKSGEINGGDVIYINADDNFKGLTIKLEIAEKNGFLMIAPGYNDFSLADFGEHLNMMTKAETAHGSVIILDTLKKFTDIMDKRQGSEFGKSLRSFISKGGTVIALAHTNKNRDAEGKLKFSGTSDIVDDADCAYVVDATESSSTHKTVVFENIKSRGDVAQQAGYRYLIKPDNYLDLLDSVEAIDEQEAALAREQQALQAKLTKSAETIEAITDAIQAGFNAKSEIVEQVHKEGGISKAVIRKVLTDHTGKDFAQGHRWRMSKGEKNAKHYHLLINVGDILANGNRYREASEGF